MQPYRYIFFLAVLASVLSGCYTEPIPGPQGPPGYDGFDGRDGRDGLDGEPGTGLMYEVEFSLNASNEWQTLFTFPPQDPIYTEDVVLAYLLWDQIEPQDGGDLIPVWKPMPISYLYEEGTLQLSYDFTATNVSLYAEAAFPLDPERDVFDNFLARIVVVPADFSVNARMNKAVNLEDYEAVSDWLGLPEPSVQQGTPFVKAMAGN